MPALLRRPGVHGSCGVRDYVRELRAQRDLRGGQQRFVFTNRAVFTKGVQSRRGGGEALNSECSRRRAGHVVIAGCLCLADGHRSCSWSGAVPARASLRECTWRIFPPSRSRFGFDRVRIRARRAEANLRRREVRPCAFPKSRRLSLPIVCP